MRMKEPSPINFGERPVMIIPLEVSFYIKDLLIFF